ncbi:MAG TPA: hypothetical protein VMW15_03985 [Terracidiphilus sp.]|jgi:hypothetical protein|nr:hypothetical protein [Terracidiphilus sp.]
MKSTLLLALVLLPTLAFAQKHGKKKHTVPAVFNSARYVWVQSMDGDLFTPGLLPADRQAIVDVQNALQDWGRYVLTARRSDADLIFVVRTGRLADAKVGGSVGTPNAGPMGNPNAGPQQHPMGTGVMYGGDVGPPDDMLKVVSTNSDGNGMQVWLRSEEGGLASPFVPLFRQLKTAVDHDYPR